MTINNSPLNSYKPIRLRVLHPEFDKKFFRLALSWKKEKPDWFQESMKVWGITDEQEIANRYNENQIDIGVFNFAKFIGLITFEEIMPTIIEAHLDCAKSATLEQMIYAVTIAKQHAFEKGVSLGIVWVQSFNRPILKLYKKVGFIPTNVSIFRGNYKNKPIEWRQFIAPNPKLSK